MSATVSPGVAPVSTPVSTPASASMWNVAEVVALLSLAAVSVAAFGWSAIALHEVAMMSGLPSWLAWGAPVIVDGPIIQAAWSLVALNRREKLGVVIPASTRRFFWAELTAAELVSFVINGVHAWYTDGLQLPQLAAAAFAGLAPVAALTVTHALTVLLEVPRTPEPQSTAGDSVAAPGDMVATPAESEATSAVDGSTAGDTDPTSERDAQILRLHEQGLSLRDIGAEVGLHHSRVAKIVKRAQELDPAATGSQSLHLVVNGAP